MLYFPRYIWEENTAILRARVSVAPTNLNALKYLTGELKSREPPHLNGHHENVSVLLSFE